MLLDGTRKIYKIYNINFNAFAFFKGRTQNRLRHCLVLRKGHVYYTMDENYSQSIFFQRLKSYKSACQLWNRKGISKC